MLTPLGQCCERSAAWWAQYLDELNAATLRSLFGNNQAMGWIAVVTTAFISFWWHQ
jgi:hypothetical protein